MAKFVVLISKGPFHGVEAEWPLRFVDQALTEGHKVQLFLAEDAVGIGNKQQKYDVHPNLENYIASIVKRGATVKVCATCALRRGLSEKDYLPKLTTGTMSEFVQAAAQADKVFTF